MRQFEELSFNSQNRQSNGFRVHVFALLQSLDFLVDTYYFFLETFIPITTEVCLMRLFES